MTKNTASERILRALGSVENLEVPINVKGQIDFKNLILVLRDATADQAAWQVRVEDRQAFYRDDELRTAISVLSDNLRLAQRNDQEANDHQVKAKLATAAREAKADRADAVQAKTQYAALLDRIDSLETEKLKLQREVEGLRAQLELVKSGHFTSIS